MKTKESVTQRTPGTIALSRRLQLPCVGGAAALGMTGTNADADPKNTMASVDTHSDAATRYSPLTPTSQVSSHIPDGALMKKLKEDDLQIRVLEEKLPQWMREMSVTAAISKLTDDDIKLLRNAEKIRATIARISEDPELEPVGSDDDA